jgi:ComF family protein
VNTSANDFLKKIPRTIFNLSGHLWHLTGLLLFEAQSCLLCQVELPPALLSNDQELSNCQMSTGAHNVITPSQASRLQAQLRYAGNQLCLECMTFFCSLNAVKTSLIGDDDSPAIACFSSGFYYGPLQEAVYQIKYLKRPELAKALAFAMLPPAVALLQPLPAVKTQSNTDIIVPVPLHKSKHKERGFNQAEELALGVGSLLGIPVDSKSLTRVRVTRPQFGLSRGERRRNIAGAFMAARGLAGKNIILVDDVLTSGATLYECALAVTAAGGNVLGATTLARARWQKVTHLEETAVPSISVLM